MGIWKWSTTYQKLKTRDTDLQTRQVAEAGRAVRRLYMKAKTSRLEALKGSEKMLKIQERDNHCKLVASLTTVSPAGMWNIERVSGLVAI